ncbi:MAG TPA: M20/M25/M40 family metallo-hydrolase [Polyangiaceae bacterium]
MSFATLVPTRLRPLWVALLLLLAEALLLRARYAPPAPLDARAPAASFSAARAIAMLSRVLGDQAPHPTGSPANDRVRERLMRELTNVGLTVEDRSGTTCGVWGFCANVHDLVGVVPGSESRAQSGALMLAAHYDSVAAGPGAADDGAGIATLLEIARSLQQAPAKHAVLFLFTDGEELGGLGARLFVERFSGLHGISAVINVEARGTTGPGILFETTEPNSELIARYASTASHPLSNSAAYTVYKALPNDTDLTIFRNHGLSGYNFAFIGGPARYHTAIDDLAHLDAGSVQSEGSAALALLRAVDANVPAVTGENAVWFDVFGFTVVRWSQRDNLGLWALTAILLTTALRLGWQARMLSAARLGLALTRLPLTLVLAVIFGFLLMAGTARAAPANWIASPACLELCCLLATLTALALSAALIPANGDAVANFNADAIWWTALSIFTSLRAPGTCYLFLLPALCAVLAAQLATFPRFAPFAVWLRVALVALTAALWFPALYFVYDAIGINLPWLETSALALALSPLAALVPAFERRPYRIVAVCAGATLICALIAQRVAPFSANAPQRESLAYHLDADSGQARFLVDASGGFISDALRRAGSFAASEIDPYPWFGGWGRKALAGPAPVIALPPPIATVLESSTSGAERHLLLHISSPRGAVAVSLGWKTTATHVKLDGVQVLPWRQGDAWVVTRCGDTVAGADVELTVAAGAPLDALVFDHSLELPGVAAPLRAARGALGTASQSGDDTVVSRAVRL